MTDESKLRDQMDRGVENARLLKLLDDTFKALEEKCFNTFRASDIHDDKGRLTCRLYLKVLDDVKERCEHQITQGEAARTDLIRLKDPSRLRTIINGRR